MKKELYAVCQGYEYKDGCFRAGLVKNSKHKSDKIYIQINDYVFHLRSDEAYALIAALGSALWSEYQLRKQDKVKLKWKTIRQIRRKQLPGCSL